MGWLGLLKVVQEAGTGCLPSYGIGSQTKVPQDPGRKDLPHRVGGAPTSLKDTWSANRFAPSSQGGHPGGHAPAPLPPSTPPAESAVKDTGLSPCVAAWLGAGVNSGCPSPSGPPRACSELPSHCPPGDSGEHRQRAPPGAEKGHSRMQREDPAHVPLPGQQLWMGSLRAAVTPPTCCPKDSSPRGTVCCSTYCMHPAGLCSGSTYCVHPAGTQRLPCEARTGRWGPKGER